MKPNYQETMQQAVNQITQYAANRGLDTQDMAVCAAVIMGCLIDECCEKADKQTVFNSLVNLVRRHANMDRPH